MIRDEDELRSRRYRFSRDFRHALGRQFVPLIASELYNVCHEVPVLFARGERGWDVVGILSDPALRRPLIDADGLWKGGYSPFVLRVHPFRRSADDRTWEVDPAGLPDAGGRPFFRPDGTEAGEFTTVKAMLADADRGRALLRDRVATLADAGLVVHVGAAFAFDQYSPALAPLFCVDAIRLSDLPPKDLAALVSGSPSALDLALASIYSMRLLRGHFDARATVDLDSRIAALVQAANGGLPAEAVEPEMARAPGPGGFVLDRSDSFDYAGLSR